MTHHDAKYFEKRFYMIKLNTDYIQYLYEFIMNLKFLYDQTSVIGRSTHCIVFQ